MQTNFIYWVAFLIISLGIAAPSQAVENPFPPDQLIVCNDVEQSSSCGDFSDSNLLQHAQSLFGGLGLNPNPNSPVSPGAVITGRVYFIIIDVSTGNVNRVVVDRYEEPSGSILQIQHVSPYPNDLDLASAAVNLDNERENLISLLTFNESNLSGEFTNQAGQTISSVLGTLNFSASNVTELTPCPTALSYDLDTIFDPTLPECHLFLNQILTEWGSESTSAADFLDALAIWSTNLHFGIASFSVPQTNAVGLVFNFEDGGRLVLTVGELDTGVVTVIADQDKSRTAEGFSFRTFKERLGQGMTASASYYETIGMFGHYSCGPQLQATGDVFQRFRIEVLEQDSMGRPTRVRIVLLSQIDIVDEVLVCNIPTY